ncbi:hypothetical protein [Anaeromyxobacter oryzae]|uniref:Uncharacterized protein n=1 Tax=Anaeromyxobacter oryzae TaxID=2918170 RepID=A0ABM7WUX6_9BACT|nr:hypothetical protein [Anaeromyxobacter oryzae]BDG03308.1 hypothetical protein AMOR_23040 [Anaeromyxobacter oryzae]
MAPLPYARRAALVVWSALIVLPLAFLVVVLAVGGVDRASPAVAPLFFWIAIGASVLDLALAWLLAPRVGAKASSDPEAVAFTRLLFAWALAEAAAIFPLVAYLLTDDARLIGIFGVDLLALVLLFPSDQRWESMRPAGAEDGRPAVRRMVR